MILVFLHAFFGDLNLAQRPNPLHCSFSWEQCETCFWVHGARSFNVDRGTVQSKFTPRHCVICQTQRWLTAQLESRGLRYRVSHTLENNQSMSRKQSKAQISPAQLDMGDVCVSSFVSQLKRAQGKNVCRPLMMICIYLRISSFGISLCLILFIEW